MRSFILTAVIAAALVPTSFTAGYAASAGKGGAHATRSEAAASGKVASGKSGAAVTRAEKRKADQDGDEAVEPDTIYPRSSIYPQYSMSAPMAYPHTRLSLIESELGKAAHHINVDRRRGELTRNEARFVRREENSARAEAKNIAARHDGRIPTASYAMLQDRISNLDRTIHRYAINSANG
jgi:hypothetical protein